VTWTSELSGAPAGPPAVTVSATYVALKNERLLALASDTGRLMWTTNAAASQAPAASGRLVFVAAERALDAIARDTGVSAWRRPLDSPPAGAPAATAQGVVVALDSGDIVAFDESGTQLWRQALGAPASVSPLASPGSLYLGLADGRVVAIDASTGTPIWESRLSGRVSGLREAGDRIFAGSYDNFFYCLGERDGRIKWRWRTGADVVGNAVVDDRRVYFSSLDNLLRALDRHHGAQRWKAPLPTRPIGGPLLFGDLLIVSGVAPVLHGFTADTGKIAGRSPLDADLSFAAAGPADASDVDEWFVILTRDGRAHRMTRSQQPEPSTR
jgi:outer membrane protein assembly factor BamB